MNCIRYSAGLYQLSHRGMFLQLFSLLSTVCAFLNSCVVGVIYLGISRAGIIVGINICRKEVCVFIHLFILKLFELHHAISLIMLHFRSFRHDKMSSFYFFKFFFFYIMLTNSRFFLFFFHVREISRRFFKCNSFNFFKATLNI